MYVESVASGGYDTLVQSALLCRVVFYRRLAHEDARAELTGLRNLIFDAGYAMPEECQLDILGVRWQPRPGTFMLYRDWAGNPAYRSCQVERQQVGPF